MELPKNLKNLIEELAGNTENKNLAVDAEMLSKRYRKAEADGRSLLNKNSEALSYAVVRMPATYGAVYSALEKVLEVTDYEPKSLIDVGAGTGAASWAVEQLINIKQISCLEREDVMRELGHSLMSESGIEVLRNANWKKFDAVQDKFDERADLVITSYMLNELSLKDRAEVVKKLWNATGQILLIVEPGTPKAFKGLLEIRNQLIQEGAKVLAPCPHEGKCNLLDNDWCHFSCRIARSKLHKQLKSASMGYEDEKFCYMAFGRQERSCSYKRVLKKPEVNKAEVKLEICTENGDIRQDIISVRDKNTYKKAKKIEWGDKIS